MKKRWVSTVLIFLCVCSGAEPYSTTSKLEDLFLGAPPGTFIFLDLDRVTLDHTHSLGSEAWYSYRWVQLRSLGVADSEIRTTAYFEMGRYSIVSRVVPVDEQLPELIRQAQVRGIVVLALTSRHSIMLEGTRRQLNSLGIDLENHAPLQATVDLLQTAQYSGGIIFADVHQKGDAMKAFLNVLKRVKGLFPTEIRFADDKAGHVQNVLEAGRELGIPTRSFHYLGTTPIISNVDPQMVDLQSSLHPAHQIREGSPLLHREDYYLHLLQCGKHLRAVGIR